MAREISPRLSLHGPLRCPTNVKLALLPLCLAALAAGCGNYDPETRLFRLAAPKPADVALEPPGVARQGETGANQARRALENCEEDRMRCNAAHLAEGLNALTFSLLTLVDTVVSFPPTHRQPGRRVWGPHFDAQRGHTFRFEMVRDTDDELSYCVHLAPGALDAGLHTRELGCADEIDDDTGLVRVLSGTLRPGDLGGAGARAGQGVMVLEGNNLVAVTESDDVPADLTIAYDNTGGATRITMQIENIEPDRTTGLLPLSYGFTREAEGAGTFAFSALADFYAPDAAGSVLEEMHITARWQDDGAGRADGVICGGDLGETCEELQYTVTQCWDEELVDTFYGDSDQNNPDEGDVSTCAFAAPLPLP